MEPVNMTLIVRLPLTTDVANSWRTGTTQLEANAREQAERAAKVRFMGRQGVQVELINTEESWVYENGQSKISLDFTFTVTAS